jgi:hypothetical protein
VLVKAVVRNLAGRAGTERKSDHQSKRACEHPSQRKWLVISSDQPGVYKFSSQARMSATREKLHW